MSSTIPIAPESTDPNKTFGIVALIVSIFFSLIGGILGIVVASVAAVNSVCDGMEPGVYDTTTGTTITCP